MKRAGVVGLIGAVALATLLLAPAAQAASAKAPSTSCSFTFKVTFDPPLQHGMNRSAFFTWDAALDGCTGGKVASGTGYGGSLGDLRCHGANLLGRSSAKMQVYWDNGKDSGINFRFDFTRSRFGGRVLGDYLRGERVRAKHITFTPVQGDCTSTPLATAEITGTIAL